MASTLVVYFSATGTTARIADRLAEAIGADSFAIEPEVAYTAADLNWHDASSRSSIEMKDESARPAIRSRIADFDEYDTFFVGFPIWWYQAPRIIETFLESYDFAGKTIVVFATSGGSGLGDTESLLAPCAPGARWLPGKLLNGAGAGAMKRWVEGLDL